MDNYCVQGNKNISETLKTLNAKKVVIFPAGRLTRLLLNGNVIENIAYICDNASELHGGNINDIPIVPVEYLEEEEEEELCVIVTSPNLHYYLLSEIERLGRRWKTICCFWPSGYARRFYDEYRFADRRVNSDKLLVVLAGYKQMLWDIVFKRIRRFLPDGIDVCILSSGVFSEELERICGENGWSYLSTKLNKLTLVQNIAISLHPRAQFIYKLDEDMFICENFFQGLMDTLEYVEENSYYRVGLVAPMIPVNPHGNVRFLEKMGLIDEYTALFGKPYYDFHTHFAEHENETVYLWKKTLPLDKTAKKFREAQFSYYACPHRFSIGAILFRRRIWEEMNGFDVPDGVGLGADERGFATYFLTSTEFYTMIMAENVLAGHYSFCKLKDVSVLNKLYLEKSAEFDICE